jgi:anti-sigma factor RsiW
MNSCGFDWKAYALGELAPEEAEAAGRHLETCSACREQVESLRLTLGTMRRLERAVPPRRIAFVSDPVIEPNWWRRVWASGPRLAFAGSALLAAAIVVHALVPRQAAEGPAERAQIEQAVNQEVARRLPAAVDARVREQIEPAVTALRTRLDDIEKNRLDQVRQEFARQRESDMRDVRSSFDVVQKRLNSMYLSTARYGGD